MFQTFVCTVFLVQFWDDRRLNISWLGRTEPQVRPSFADSIRHSGTASTSVRSQRHQSIDWITVNPLSEGGKTHRARLPLLKSLVVWPVTGYAEAYFFSPHITVLLFWPKTTRGRFSKRIVTAVPQEANSSKLDRHVSAFVWDCLRHLDEDPVCFLHCADATCACRSRSTGANRRGCGVPTRTSRLNWRPTCTPTPATTSCCASSSELASCLCSCQSRRCKWQRRSEGECVDNKHSLRFKRFSRLVVNVQCFHTAPYMWTRNSSVSACSNGSVFFSRK